jgi:hypothetical protein
MEKSPMTPSPDRASQLRSIAEDKGRLKRVVEALMAQEKDERESPDTALLRGMTTRH